MVLDTDTGTYSWRCNLDAIHRNFNALVDWPNFLSMFGSNSNLCFFHPFINIDKHHIYVEPFENPTLFLRAEKENYIRERYVIESFFNLEVM